MTELRTANSFIVRIYRIDTEDQRKLTGLVEALDGSWERTPFTDIIELAAVLNRGVGKRNKQDKKRVRAGELMEQG
jgi:hypothetical protein